jgi:hypothetical protein
VNPLWDSRDFALGPVVRGTTSLWPLRRGTKILLDYFVDEALIARFSRGFKERCAVYAKYFGEAVPFWEKGAVKFSQAWNLKTNLFCRNHRKDSAPTRVLIVLTVNAGPASKGMPPAHFSRWRV